MPIKKGVLPDAGFTQGACGSGIQELYWYGDNMNPDRGKEK